MSFRVLIVDDSPIIRAVLIKTIGMANIDVSDIFEAANGLEALKILSEHWIDLVCADLNMPQMNGVELVKRMAEDNLLGSIPVVIISSEHSQARIEELKQRGIRAFLRKPFRPEQFREIISTVLSPGAHGQGSNH